MKFSLPYLCFAILINNIQSKIYFNVFDCHMVHVAYYHSCRLLRINLRTSMTKPNITLHSFVEEMSRLLAHSNDQTQLRKNLTRGPFFFSSFSNIKIQFFLVVKGKKWNFFFKESNMWVMELYVHENKEEHNNCWPHLY